MSQVIEPAEPVVRLDVLADPGGTPPPIRS